MLRGIWTELRRGPAVLVGLLVAVSCTALLLADYPEWTGRWVGMTVWLRGELTWATSLTAGFTAWVAGRQHRRGLADFTAATPRPQWQRTIRDCTAVGICAMVGYLVAFGFGAVLVGRISTYSNAHWVPFLLIGAFSLIPACLLGHAIGTRSRWFLAAPVTVGLVALIVSLPRQAGARWALLDAGATEGWSDAVYLHWRGHAGQAALLLGLAAGFLIAGSVRRWWLSAAPVAAGLVAALLLFGSHPAGLWRDDPVARQAVCMRGAAEFCTYKENGYALAATVPALQRALAPIAGMPGVPTHFDDFSMIGGHSDFYLVSSNNLDIFGRLGDPDITVSNFLSNLHLPCRKENAADAVFMAWLSGDASLLPNGSARAALHRLNGLPKIQQHKRIEGFLAARRQCDSRAGRFVL